MNNIKFLICNIHASFPAEIIEIIFKKVQENAAKSIQKMYYLRVKINLDAFLIFNKMSRAWWRCWSRREICNINKMITFYATRIRYSFIQEPGIWIDNITDIIDICGYNNHFHINNAYYIINSVKLSNSIFTQTGIAWWENL